MSSKDPLDNIQTSKPYESYEHEKPNTGRFLIGAFFVSVLAILILQLLSLLFADTEEEKLRKHLLNTDINPAHFYIKNESERSAFRNGSYLDSLIYQPPQEVLRNDTHQAIICSKASDLEPWLGLKSTDLFDLYKTCETLNAALVAARDVPYAKITLDTTQFAYVPNRVVVRGKGPLCAVHNNNIEPYSGQSIKNFLANRSTCLSYLNQ